jgi:hypothetical protein
MRIKGMLYGSEVQANAIVGTDAGTCQVHDRGRLQGPLADALALEARDVL